MPKYRKKPVVIEAVQFTGKNEEEIERFVDKPLDKLKVMGERETVALFIETLEGEMTANVGDYIIKGINGEFYPCKPDIFEKTYEVVKE
ncbi:hypothetical protein [Halalkalibacterium ligniniphilum]|uniref:hypothetical protein n=1 Tax=Halalkalibacterium ligniniphilum TaxID=1134413 RepID=UPI0003486413|nr:hypothetical protein [Halalkalibacterium ligniniphilum]